MLLSIGAFAEGRADFYEVGFVRVDRNGFGYVQFKNNLTGTPASCT